MNEMKIEAALRSIGDLKAPGIDGYGVKFFKKSWNIIGKDVIKVVQEFFGKEILDKVVNYTLVVLIPNTNEVKSIKEYRPISYCRTLYKIL